MNKQNFDPDGIIAVQTMLHELSDSALLVEAHLLANDLKAFMNKYFNFTPSQIAYLNHMPVNASFAIGSQMAAILTLRNMITMDEMPENEEEPKRPKEIKPTVTGYISYVDGANSSLKGSLAADIIWKLQ